MAIFTYTKPYRWFAWHPVWTDDRGWRWLRVVWRRREIPAAHITCPYTFFGHSVEAFR